MIWKFDLVKSFYQMPFLVYLGLGPALGVYWLVAQWLG